MARRNIPFSPPDIREEDIQAVAEALRSGWITTGPRTKEFEQQIVEYLDVEGAVALNSATAALELALRVMGIGPGDEVIVPAYTYTATASVVVHVGATLRMVDVLPDTVTMDPAQVEAAINPHTKAIIPVDVAGIVADLDALYALVEAKRALFQPSSPRQEALGRIAVIVDAAHSFGATRKEHHAGTFGDFTCFSFHAVKNLTTAEGGAIVWRKGVPFDDQALYHELQLWSLHGQDKDALTKNKPGAWEYDIVMPGYKCNMTDTLAALGLSQLQRYGDMMDRRHAIIRRYDKAVVEACGAQALVHEGETFRSSGHLYISRLPGFSVERRNEFIMRMAAMGVATNVHYKPLPRMTAYRALGFSIEDYPNADDFYANEVTLPLHTCLSDEDVEDVIEAFCTVWQEMGK